MVLWEVTLATAYFLGLRRTYRLALGVQRRLIGPDNPRLRQFLHRRTRAIFDVVIKVHQNIQHRDIEAGRNLGNWVLRWLDRMKPSAEIRSLSTNRCLTPAIPILESSNRMPAVARKPYVKLADRVVKGRLLFARWNLMAKYSPTVAMMMMQPMKSLGMNGQLRQLTGNAYQKPANGFNRYEGVFRQDIAILMQRN
ncbi:uncharacterized protein LOC110022774 [Phalaenopsis equestris]|uniref:uncharacterized protein LOC110022774 n=1 Tax=Phalaenopsis equestris TaxID=78828 RepID=UPI0009E29851|nr:uncharacterized protein LOC110022774 [Phalaenopsis equestris]